MGHGLRMLARNALMLVPRAINRIFPQNVFAGRTKYKSCPPFSMDTPKDSMTVYNKSWRDAPVSFVFNQNLSSGSPDTHCTVCWKGWNSCNEWSVCTGWCHNEATKELWWATRTTVVGSLYSCHIPVPLYHSGLVSPPCRCNNTNGWLKSGPQLYQQPRIFWWIFCNMPMQVLIHQLTQSKLVINNQKQSTSNKCNVWCSCAESTGSCKVILM